MPAAAETSARERDLALNHLKIHCHRAAVETVLRKVFTTLYVVDNIMAAVYVMLSFVCQNGMRRAQVRITKRVSKLPFPE